MFVKRSVTVSLWVHSTCLCFLAVSPLLAQSHTLEVSQYLHMSWTAQGGFFPPGVTGFENIAETSDGYLWLPGPDFLLRFDGVRFVKWRPPRNESLPGKPIYRLLGSKDGSLWIGGVGLAELKANGEFRRYHQIDGTQIEGLLEDKDGGIWAGGGHGRVESPKLCRFFHGEADCFPAHSFLGEWAGAIQEDAKGQVLACSNTGIWRLGPGQPLKLAALSAMIPCRAFSSDSKGTLIFADFPDLKMVTSDGRAQLYPIKVDKAFGLMKDREGDLWVSTIGQGLVHIHEGRVDRFTASDGLSSNSPHNTFQDREGNVWAATSDGLDRFTKPGVQWMTDKQGLSNPAVRSIIKDGHDRLWAGTASGLDTLVEGRWARSTARLPDEDVGSIFQTSKGRMLVTTGAKQGLVWFDGKKTTRLPIASGEDVFGFAEDRRGDLWAASREEGLLHLDANGKLIEAFDHKALGKFGVAIAYDPKRDGLWLTSRIGDLALFKDGKFVEQYGPKDGLGEGIIRDLHVDDDGGVWASTRVGLAHFENGARLRC